MTVIYGLFDPDSDECRYVGKTSRSPNSRLRQHIQDAKRRPGEIPRFRWINSLLAVGKTPLLRVLEVCHDDWRSAEQRWIGVFRARGAALLNCTDGGDGIEGFRHSETTRIRMSEAARRRDEDLALRIRRGESVRRAYEDDAARKRLSEALKVAFSSPDVRKRLSDAQKAATNLPEARAKRSAALKGRSFSPEHRAKLSASMTGKKRSPESIAASAAENRGRKVSEETRERMREAARRRYAVRSQGVEG